MTGIHNDKEVGECSIGLFFTAMMVAVVICRFVFLVARKILCQFCNSQKTCEKVKQLVDSSDVTSLFYATSIVNLLKTGKSSCEVSLYVISNKQIT